MIPTKLFNQNTSISIFLIFVFTSLLSCVDLEKFEDFEIVNNGAEYAIPLINSQLTLENVLTEDLEYADLSYDENGVAVIKYEADVVRKKANEIFKPIVFPGPIAFNDSLEFIRFDQIDNYIVEKGIIRGDSIRFGFENSLNEELTIVAKIHEVSKSGEYFRKQFIVAPNSTFVSPLFALADHEFVTPNNYLSFSYDARKSNGERVLLNNSYFEFTYFLFDFVQGFLGKNTQKLNDHQISVNIFELWKSGILEFEDPKIKVRLDNSFGFPVKANINHFEITNLAGETVALESTIFDNDIFFDYPTLDEIGVVKSSEFIFDKDNSNFASAFNQKITEISYDVDAIANPDNDPTAVGFFVFDSYYLLNVAVELPISFKAENFQLEDKFPIDSINFDLDLVEEFEIKSFIVNKFPIDSYVQIYFLDENDIKIDSLFNEGEHFFPAANINSDGTITPSNEDPIYLTYGEERKNILKDIKQIYSRLRFSSKVNDGEYARIKKNMGLDIKMGVKFKLK